MLTGINRNINFGNKYGIANKPIDIQCLKALNILNLRILGLNTVSGSTFETRVPADFEALRRIGVHSIVDFRADASEKIGNKCVAAGIQYKNFPLDNVLTLQNPNYFYLDKVGKLRVTDKFVKELKNYFEIMDSENSYVGCQYGIDRTNVGLVLNFLLNPKVKHGAPEILTWPGERRKSVINRNTKVIKKILKALTDEQKQFLGLSLENNDYTNRQILKLLQKNKRIDIDI